MPENTPDSEPAIIADVVDAAKRKETMDLSGTDLAEILDKKDAMKSRAEAVLQTREEWKALKDILDKEKTDPANKDIVEDAGGAEGLAAIEARIDAELTGEPDTVAIESIEETEPTTFMERTKAFLSSLPSGTIGMAVRGWIGLQRMLISLGVVQGSPQQLDAMENLYSRFFGVSELIDQAKGLLEGSGISIVKDKKDRNAYNDVRKQFNKDLAAKIKEDPENESITREGFTLQSVFQDTVNGYLATFRGVNGRTTLTGIVKGQRPAESADSSDA